MHWSLSHSLNCNRSSQIFQCANPSDLNQSYFPAPARGSLTLTEIPPTQSWKAITIQSTFLSKLISWKLSVKLQLHIKLLWKQNTIFFFYYYYFQPGLNKVYIVVWIWISLLPRGDNSERQMWKVQQKALSSVFEGREIKTELFVALLWISW